jgi:hypothetical protein
LAAASVENQNGPGGAPTPRGRIDQEMGMADEMSDTATEPTINPATFLLTEDDLRGISQRSSLSIVLSGVQVRQHVARLAKLFRWYWIDLQREEANKTPGEHAAAAAGLAKKIDAVLNEIDADQIPARDPVTEPDVVVPEADLRDEFTKMMSRLQRPGALAMQIEEAVPAAERSLAIADMTRELLRWTGGFLDVAGARAGDRVMVNVGEFDANAKTVVACAAAALRTLREMVNDVAQDARTKNAERRNLVKRSLFAGLRESYEELHGRGYTVSNTTASAGGRGRDTVPAGPAMAWTEGLLRLAAQRSDAGALRELAEWARRTPDGVARRIRETRAN